MKRLLLILTAATGLSIAANANDYDNQSDWTPVRDERGVIVFNWSTLNNEMTNGYYHELDIRPVEGSGVGVQFTKVVCNGVVNKDSNVLIVPGHKNSGWSFDALDRSREAKWSWEFKEVQASTP